MNNSNLVNKRVEWDFACAPTMTGGNPVRGSGIVHGIAHDPGIIWNGFVLLVELDSGELTTVPQEKSNMRVCKEDFTP